MNKFKVGDKVRVVNNECLYNGQVGTIKRLKFYLDSANFFNSNALAVIMKDNKTICINEENLELVKESNRMTLSDLNENMIAETRDGERFLIIGKKTSLASMNSWIHIGSFNDDLTNRNTDNYDIVKLWKPRNSDFWCGGLQQIFEELEENDISNYFELIYLRKEPKKMTLSQICDELGYDVEIVKD